jgi:hypothetical protein
MVIQRRLTVCHPEARAFCGPKDLWTRWLRRWCPQITRSFVGILSLRERLPFLRMTSWPLYSKAALRHPREDTIAKNKQHKGRPAGRPRSHKRCYGITPAGGCGIGPAVVAAAASFRIR